MKYKKIIMPVILIIIFIIICFISYGKGGCFIWDHYRDPDIAEAILNGKILYKDIMVLFAPLSYYLNAFLFFLFSSNLNVLYCAGIINSAIILICIYKIMYEISSENTAFITILSILLIFVSKITDISSTNWFFPYTYAIIYAFAACMLSLTFYILYIKRSNLKYLYTACFFIGLSVSFKFDYSFFVIVLIISFLRLNSFKKFLQGLCFFATPILLTFIILYIQTGNDFFKILYDEIVYLYKYITNPLTIEFYKKFCPIIINSEILNSIIVSFLTFIQFFIFIFFIIFLYYKFLLKLPIKIIIPKLCGLGVIVYLFIFLYSNPNLLINFFKKSIIDINSYLMFLDYLILFFSIGYFIYKKITKDPFSEKEKLMYLLLFISYLINFRCFIAIDTGYIGNFNIIIFWMLFIYIILEVLPEKFSCLNNECYRNTFFIALIMYSFIFVSNSIKNYNHLQYKIETDKGFFYTTKDYYHLINNLIFKRVKSNIKDKNKSLLYICEGSYIYYLLNMPLWDMNLYQLQAHTLPAIGDDYIIMKLKQKQTDYIYIFNWRYENTFFGDSYGQKLYNYIRKNYKLEEILYNTGDIVYIYKIKPNNITTLKEDNIENYLPLVKGISKQ